MTILDKYRDERDANGDLAALAIAIDAIEQGECDCYHGEPPCVGCASYAALVEVVKERNDALEKLAKVRQELELAAAHWCDCGTCLGCRVGDVVWE